MTIKLYGEAKWGLTFIKYTSPTILGVAIGLLIMFAFYIFRQLRLKDRIQNLETKLENYLSHKFFRNK